MKLHELEENKIYVGDDGKEYQVEADALFLHIVESTGLAYWHVVKSISALTQNFTPKKVKRTVDASAWMNIYPSGLKCLYKTKEEANDGASKNRIACVELRGTYEVEE